MDFKQYQNEEEFAAFSDDEDLDFAIASSLQSQFENKANFESLSNQTNPKDDTYLRKLDEDLDYALALSLQSAYNKEIEKSSSNRKISTQKSVLSKPLSIVDKKWELIDPNPDIYALFQEYSKRFFYGALGSVSVSWSPRMTLCAGVCSYEGRGGLCSIRLSKPLLQLRPRKDLVETLLHEMIHAYLFVTHNWRDRGDHGPKFLEHMHRINRESGSNITVYHSFHDEVDHYRKHIWQCQGQCKHWPPYYGQVKRAMNRAPGPNDAWWADHQSSCGGKFVKIEEPDKNTNRSTNNRKGVKRKPSTDLAKNGSRSDIRGFFKNEDSKPSEKIPSKPVIASSFNIATITSLAEDDNTDLLSSAKVQPKTNYVPFQGTGFKLGGRSSEKFDEHPLLSYSTGIRKKDSSSSFKKSKDRNPDISKFPRDSSWNNIRSTVKVPITSTSAASNSTPKKLMQRSMDKYLSPQQSIKSTKLLSGSDSAASSKITCPLCFLQFKESDINAHVDRCLL